MEIRAILVSVCLGASFLTGCTTGAKQTPQAPAISQPVAQVQPETRPQPEALPDSDGFTEMTLPEQPISKSILQTAQLISVYDGDTLKVNLNCSEPVFCKALPVRVKGIDTPELKTNNACERAKAQQAKAYATTFLKGKLELRNCSRDKYFRLLCDVYSNGESLANALIQRGLAYPYDGGTKRKINFCDTGGNK